MITEGNKQPKQLPDRNQVENVATNSPQPQPKQLPDRNQAVVIATTSPQPQSNQPQPVVDTHNPVVSQQAASQGMLHDVTVPKCII